MYQKRVNPTVQGIGLALWCLSPVHPPPPPTKTNKQTKNMKHKNIGKSSDEFIKILNAMEGVWMSNTCFFFIHAEWAYMYMYMYHTYVYTQTNKQKQNKETKT